MSDAGHDHHPAADECFRGSATPLEQELVALEPAPPAPGLRERIAAELAASTTPTRGADWPAARGQAVRVVIERLVWAVGGALAATVILGLPAGDVGPAAPGPIVVADAAAGGAARRPMEPTAAPIQPASPTGPLLSEQTSRWADEGVRFLDDTTPARVLRRMVVERHRSADGRAEVRVPRADVILLPVAFQ